MTAAINLSWSSLVFSWSELSQAAASWIRSPRVPLSKHLKDPGVHRLCIQRLQEPPSLWLLPSPTQREPGGSPHKKRHNKNQNQQRRQRDFWGILLFALLYLGTIIRPFFLLCSLFFCPTLLYQMMICPHCNLPHFYFINWWFAQNNRYGSRLKTKFPPTCVT
jgi:hypothetical protein